jgi:large subunit ribosomal protein L11
MVEQIKSLVEGGKATAGPPLGPALGPLGVPINKVIEEINAKTKDFAGIQVPVTVTVDPKTKAFEIEVGTPPVSSLIKRELSLEKGAANAKEEKVADMVIEQVNKIALMKESTLKTGSFKAAVKTIVGTCVSMGIMVEGKPAKEALIEIDDGKYDDKINSKKTELSDEERKRLEEEKAKLGAEIAKAREAEQAIADEVLAKMDGKTDAEKKAALKDAGVSSALVNKLIAPAGAGGEGAAPGGAPGAAPAADGEKKEAPAEEKKE